MKSKNNYRVYGVFDNRNIDVKLEAYSAKQAKFKAALDSGATGKNLLGFMKSKNIKVSGA